MISLRKFCAEDALVLCEIGSPGCTMQQAEELIAAWQTNEYNHRYFAMFAIVSDGAVVGMISLYEHSSEVISIGPEVFAPYRRRGFAAAAMQMACEIAKERGYTVVSQQIRCDNAASIALHRKLGFVSDGTEFINKKGNVASIYRKNLL